ncbi:MAG TPA: c-type cytochrome domain-containing protein [Prosthecobacter sp.]
MRRLLSLPIILLAACAVRPDTPDERTRYFLTEVRPVLQQHCLACHNGMMPPPALNLTNAETAFRTRPGGAWIVPGDPASSLLIKAVERGGTHMKMMPRTEVSLTDDQIGMLREWIEDGAYWPEGKDGVLRVRKSRENS